jgi:hypothetical protein
MDTALLIGINNYPYPNKLHGCVNDIRDIAAELIGKFKFAQANISQMADADATAVNIRSALEKSVGKLEAGDRFLFWYSGHGSQLVAGNVATDVICPVDFNFTAATSVTVDDFHAVFSKIPRGVAAAWGSDSCHSGDLERSFHGLGVPRMFRPPPSQEASQQLALRAKTVRRFRDISAELPNIALLAGCQSNQTSADADIDGRYNGAFTYYFLKQLATPGALAQALQKLIPLVQAALTKAGYSQTPQLSGPPGLAAKAFLAP